MVLKDEVDWEYFLDEDDLEEESEDDFSDGLGTLGNAVSGEGVGGLNGCGDLLLTFILDSSFFTLLRISAVRALLSSFNSSLHFPNFQQ